MSVPSGASPLKPNTQRFSFRQRLLEISMFFDKRDKVHQTMYRLVERLEQAGLPYAIVGGMAVNAHRYVRTTGDVDFLIAPEHFAEFQRAFVPEHYEPVPGRGRRFKDRVNGVAVDFLVTGFFPGTGKPGPIAYPEPSAVGERIDDIQVVNLATLVELKLAARRHRDFGDVVELIRYNDLDESYAAKLHASVRGDFLECLEEKRREDEYEARNG